MQEQNAMMTNQPKSSQWKRLMKRQTLNNENKSNNLKLDLAVDEMKRIDKLFNQFEELIYCK